MVVELSLGTKHIGTEFTSIFKHVGEMATFHMISHISRIFVGVVTNDAGVLAAQVIFVDIAL